MIYVSGVPYSIDGPPDDLEPFKEKVNDHPAPVIELRRGSGWLISGAAGFDVDVINPPSNSLLDPGENNIHNANAIVLRINYQGRSILLPSDIYSSQEQQLIDNIRPINELIGIESLDSDALQASHHGSDNGNSLEFLEETKSPRVVIDARTSSKKPDKNALDRFNQTNMNTYQTGVHGNIKIIIDEDGDLSIKTERNGEKTDPDDIEDENENVGTITGPSVIEFSQKPSTPA